MVGSSLVRLRVCSLLATLLVSTGIAIAVPHNANAAEPAPITGRWITEGGQSIIQIRPCGSMLCGNVVKVLIPDPKAASTDVKNPDPALRNRSMATLQILSNLRPDGDVWAGQVYDPRSGKTYRSRVKAKGANAIDVQGCLAFLCQSQIWKKAP